MTSTSILVCLVIFFPWLGAIAVWLIGDKHPNAQHNSAVIFGVANAVISIFLLFFPSDEAVISINTGGIFGYLTFVPDGLATFLTAIAAVIGSLAVLFSVGYMNGEKQLSRYYFFVLFFIGTMAGLFLSGSIFYMFIFWEITAICSYALISFYNDDPNAVRGGIKALIITQLGGIGLLIGALYTYEMTGTYQLSVLLEQATLLNPGIMAFVGYGFIVAAAAKSAQVPLHTWLPDAMEAPTPISALIHAATMVNAGVYLLARFYPAFENVPGWTMTVMVMGAISALFAALMALVATDLKRTLAYSTVSQLGYMVYAIGTGAVFAGTFHLLSHAVFKALLFLSAGTVIHAVGTRNMHEMGGLRKKMPFTFAMFIIGGFALAGLPIANGFFSKELILEEGLANGPMWLYVIMLIGAGITALYTIRMISLVFFGEANEEKQLHLPSITMQIPLGILGIGSLTTWLLLEKLNIVLIETLPFHHFEETPIWETILHIIETPATWIAMAVIAIGILLWIFRDLFKVVVKALNPLVKFLDAGMGFEHLNQGVSYITKAGGEVLRKTQTGSMNWNLAGVMGGLLLLLLVVFVIGA